MRVVHQCAEKRRRQRVEVTLGFADDVARHEFRRVLEHVDEAVKFTQDDVRNMTRGLGLAIQVNRDLGVLEADFLDEFAQVQYRRIEFGAGRELLVVDRQDEGRGARLLLGELREIAVAGGAENLHAFLLDGVGERANAQARGIFGTEIFIDDDDRKAEFHGRRLLQTKARPG